MSSTPSTLTSLNDDCLYEILSQNCIEVKDLLEVASTCKDLQRIARKIFERSKQINHMEEMKNLPLQKIQAYLRHFGEFVKAIDLSVFKKPINVLHMALKCCSDLTNVCSKRMPGHADFKTYHVSQISAACSRLEQLKYRDIKFTGNILFDSSSKVEKLLLSCLAISLPVVQFPQLHELALTSITYHNLNAFLEQNDQLQRLHLNDVYLDRCFGGALQNLISLAEFSYTDNLTYPIFPETCCFDNMKALRQLNLKASAQHIFEILKKVNKAKVPLDSLLVEYRSFHDGITEQICRLKKIEKLVLNLDKTYKSPNCYGLMQIIKYVPKLKHFYCASSTIEPENIRIAFEHPNQLQSATFRLDFLNFERNQSDIEAISTIASNQNIHTSIYMIRPLSKTVSVAGPVQNSRWDALWGGVPWHFFFYWNDRNE